jgi:hypothetical protein
LAGAFLSILLIFSTTSCKKCKLSEGDQNTGMIIQDDYIIYPKSGYMTDNMSGNFNIGGSHPFADKFEISFNGGATRGPVNYSQYTILANPMTIPCEASLNRSVTYNAALDFYTYDLTGETCKGCKNDRFVENYVLIPAIPANAQVLYEQNVTQK